MKRILIGILLLITLTFTYGKGRKKHFSSPQADVVVATDATWPPMEYVDENKKIVGFDIDLFNAVADIAGLNPRYKPVSWDGIFAGLVNGSYDLILSSVTITDERKKSMDFSIPYVNMGQTLLVRKDGKSIQELKDLAGLTVGAQIGTTGAFEVEKIKDAKLKSYTEVALAVADLVNGNLDGVMLDYVTASNFVFQNESYKGKLKFANSKPFTSEYYGIVVKKGNKELLNKINAALTRLIDSGKVEELKKKWFTQKGTGL